MARAFDQNYGFVASAFPQTTLPITLAGWFRPRNVAKGDPHTILSVEDNAALEYEQLRSGPANGRCEAVSLTQGSGGEYISTAGIATQGVWSHYAGVFLTTSRTAYFNGVAGGTSTATVSPLALFYARVGYRWGGYDNPVGDLAEVAAWGVALTPEQIAALAKGVSPVLIQPANLLTYWNFNGNPADPNVNEFDQWKHGRTLVITGGYPKPKVDHTRVFYRWHTTVPDAVLAQTLLQAAGTVSFSATPPTLAMPAPLAAAPTLRFSSSATLISLNTLAAAPTLGFSATGFLLGSAVFGAAPTISVATSAALADNPPAAFGILSTQTNKTAGVLIHEK